MGQHGQRDVPVPTLPVANLVVIQSAFSLGSLKALLDLPALSGHSDNRRETELIPAFDSGISWRGIDDVFASGTNAAGAQCRATRAIAMR